MLKMIEVYLLLVRWYRSQLLDWLVLGNQFLEDQVIAIL